MDKIIDVYCMGKYEVVFRVLVDRIKAKLPIGKQR